MTVEVGSDERVPRIASAIGDPARARMLYSLLDGHARTATELAVVAGVGASTASAHLARLTADSLLIVEAQGKHRYYRLRGPKVARVLEGLSVIAEGTRPKFVPNTPSRLRFARTCYDHLAGSLGVALHDAFLSAGYLIRQRDAAYQLTAKGETSLASLGLDLSAAHAARRRRFAYGCLDWSERCHHLGGSLATTLLEFTLRQKWLIRDLDSRAVFVTPLGCRKLNSHFDLNQPALER